MKRKVRVLIIEGSAVTRRILTAILAADRELEVAGAVPDLHAAREAVARLEPDVVTLDVAVLSKRALGSLERFMRTSQAPVVLVSPPTQTAREMTALALNLGAVGVVRLPSRELVRRMPDVVSEMLDTVKAVARGRPRPKTVSARAEPQAPPAERAAPAASAERVIAVGASTGGTEAIRQFLMAIRRTLPGSSSSSTCPNGSRGPSPSTVTSSVPSGSGRRRTATASAQVMR